MCHNMANQMKFSKQGFEDGVHQANPNPPEFDPGKTAYNRAYERGETVRKRLENQQEPARVTTHAQELINAICQGVRL